MFLVGFDEFWLGRFANLDCVGASRVESASWRDVYGAWNFSFQWFFVYVLLRVGLWNG